MHWSLQTQVCTKGSSVPRLSKYQKEAVPALTGKASEGTQMWGLDVAAIDLLASLCKQLVLIRHSLPV